MLPVKHLLVLSGLALPTTVALAREFWLQPTSFRVAVGAAVPLRLLVGSNFAGTSWRAAHRVRRFVRLGPSLVADSTELRPVLVADSVAPTCGYPTLGTHLVLLTSALALTELPADEFTAYLRQAGLDNALRYRQQQGQTITKPGREAYRRCAKTLVLATARPNAPASPADTTYRRVLNLPLELVPEQNPYYLRPGAVLTVRVLRGGQPAPGVLVQVWDATPLAAGQPTATVALPHYFATHANNNGRVLLRLPSSGPYLLAATCIESAPPALASRADWLSTWATLTFGGPVGSVAENWRPLTK